MAFVEDVMWTECSQRWIIEDARSTFNILASRKMRKSFTPLTPARRSNGMMVTTSSANQLER
jgi:hypothetical protein